MRANTSPSFPIIVMTRNEGEYLLRCINSMIKTVSIDVHIYIVDNCSDDFEHISILKKIETDFTNDVTVIWNYSNRWILGINKTLQLIANTHSSPYFFMTDGDISFQNCKARPCWLTYLIKKMDENLVVGKIGYSLDWHYLSCNPEMSDILRQEKSLYDDDRKINSLYIAQVDTTAALYRWDWSIESNGKFYPDHMRYLRPEYYSCRTDKTLVVEHLGWYKYKINSLPRSTINSKVVCFTLVGASLKDEILAQASFLPRLFFRILSRPIQIFWILRRYYFLLKYIWLKGRKSFDGQR